VTNLYADTSALVGAYLRDESDHARLKDLLRTRAHKVGTLEFAHLEFIGAIRSAHRSQRLRKPDRFLEAFRLECSDETIRLLRPNPDQLLSEGMRIMGSHRLRTLDALHLATALLASRDSADDNFRFVTRDAAQADAASAEGLDVI